MKIAVFLAELGHCMVLLGFHPWAWSGALFLSPLKTGIQSWKPGIYWWQSWIKFGWHLHVQYDMHVCWEQCCLFLWSLVLRLLQRPQVWDSTWIYIPCRKKSRSRGLALEFKDQQNLLIAFLFQNVGIGAQECVTWLCQLRTLHFLTARPLLFKGLLRYLRYASGRVLHHTFLQVLHFLVWTINVTLSWRNGTVSWINTACPFSKHQCTSAGWQEALQTLRASTGNCVFCLCRTNGSVIISQVSCTSQKNLVLEGIMRALYLQLHVNVHMCIHMDAYNA